MAVACSAVLFSAPQPARAASRPNYPRLAFWWCQVVPDTTRAKWDMGVLSENDPARPTADRSVILAQNPDFQFLAQASGRELDYKASPTQAPSWEAERIGAIPTSWILKQVGSTLSSAITNSATSIPVANGTRFVAGDLAIVDNEKMKVVSVSGNTLAVTRGMAGSAAVTHAAGAKISPAVATWANTVTLDMSPNCPLGKATGEFASPVNERAHDWMARRTVAFYNRRAYYGLFIDVANESMWLSYQGTGPTKIRSIGTATDPNTPVSSYTAFDDSWQTGMKEFFALVRAGVGDTVTIIGNGSASPEYLNGGGLEDEPRNPETSSRWQYRFIARESGKDHYRSLLEWQAGPNPERSTIVVTHGSSTDYRQLRFGLTSSLLADTYFFYTQDATHKTLPWFDEYDGGGIGKGYLGQPAGSAYQVGAAWRRQYTGGTAIVNPSTSPVTVQLGGTYRKIAGTQAPTVNDGSLVTAVTVPAKDGIILLAPGAPAPVYRFYNKKNGSHFYTASAAEKNSVIAKLSATYSLDGRGLPRELRTHYAALPLLQQEERLALLHGVGGREEQRHRQPLGDLLARRSRVQRLCRTGGGHGAGLPLLQQEERLALLHRVRGREGQRPRQALGDLLARRCRLLRFALAKGICGKAARQPTGSTRGASIACRTSSEAGSAALARREECRESERTLLRPSSRWLTAVSAHSGARGRSRRTRLRSPAVVWNLLPWAVTAVTIPRESKSGRRIERCLPGGVLCGAQSAPRAEVSARPDRRSDDARTEYPASSCAERPAQ